MTAVALADLFGSTEHALAHLFDRLPVGTAVIDRQFRLLRCNPTWAEFIEQYTPSAAADVVPGVSLFDLEPGTEAVLRDLFAPVFAGEIVRQDGVRLESGGIVSYWDVVLTPLEHDGAVVAALDVSLDATERVRNRRRLQATLDALRESETNLRSTVENARGYAVYRIAVDPAQPYQGRVVLVSPSIRDVTGIDEPADFSAWFRDVHPDDSARVEAANRRSLTEGAPFDETLRIFHHGRRAWRWVHTVSNPVYDDAGRLTHFNGLIIDVTDQKQAEATLSELNATLERQVTARTAEIARRHHELQALYRADERLHQHLDLDAVLQTLVDVAIDVLSADKSSLLVWDDARERLVVRAVRGFKTETVAEMVFGPNDGTVGRVAVDGKAAVVEDAATTSGVATHITDAEGIRAFMHFPITVGGQIFGVFNVDYTQPRAFSAAEQRLFSALAQRAALAIENAQLYQAEQTRRRESERRRQVAEGLRDILVRLNTDEPLAELLDAIVDQADRLIDSDVVALYLLQDDSATLKVQAVRGASLAMVRDAVLPAGEGTIGRVVVDGQPLIFGAVDQDRRHPPQSPQDLLDTRPSEDQPLPPASDRAPFQAVLALPLVAQGTTYGALAFYYRLPHVFATETIEVATTFAEQAALALQNATLRNRAEQVAVMAERNRLARELHDAVTQTLFSASLIADVLPRIWTRRPDVARDKLEELRELTRGALAEMRTLLLELRPATLTETSLGELLRQLAAAVTGRSRLKIDVTVSGEQPLPPDVQVAFYRIAQEALNNAVKHAAATVVAVALVYRPNAVTLTVTDNGSGFDPSTVAAPSLGLSIMRERAAKIGAQLTIHSKIGHGTTIRVTRRASEANV